MRRPLRFYATTAYVAAVTMSLVLAAFEYVQPLALIRVVVFGAVALFLLVIGEGFAKGMRLARAHAAALAAQREKLAESVKVSEKLIAEGKAKIDEFDRMLVATRIGLARDEIHPGDPVEMDPKTGDVRRAKPTGPVQ